MAYFEYCTIKDLRAEGVTFEEAQVNRALYLIRVASARINQFTSQVFAPIVGDQYVDGRDSPLVFLPNLLPIAKLSAISIISSRTSRRRATNVLPDRREFTVALANVELSQDNRFVEWITDETSNLAWPYWAYPAESETWFPRGRKNIKLTGVFGWLEGDGELSTTVTAAASQGAGKVVVADVTGWEEGMWAVFTFPDGTVKTQVISGVDTTTSALLFATGDPSKLKFDVPDTSTVESYGSTPLLIRRAATRLVIRDMPQLSAPEGSQDDIMQQAIVEERIDNYRYKIDPDLIAERIESGSTGDAQVDSILQQFIDEIPVYVGMV
jgi:hypothetical protein